MTESNQTGTQRRPWLKSRLGPRSKKVLLITGGMLVALLIAEIALRISGFTYFNPYIVDREVGYSLRPGAEGWWQREGLTYIKINSHGWRDREHTLAKPPGTFRIAVLGDSYAEAFQVPLEKAFWSVMERQLAGCPLDARPKIEALNFGVSGFSTTRELLLLQQRVWHYSPDAIVLLVTTGNDVRDNSRALNEYSNQPLPYFVIQDGRLVPDNSLLAARNRTLSFRLQQTSFGKIYKWFQAHSRLLGVIYAAREAYQSSSETSDRQKRFGSLNEPGLDSEVYREPVSREWTDAWQVTEALIVQMRDEVRAKGTRFLVVTGSMGVQVNPDSVAREKFMSGLGIRSLFYPDERIKALGEREGFRVLNLSPVLAEYADRNKVFLHGPVDAPGKGHWNELGHRLAGELIAGKLCQVINDKD